MVGIENKREIRQIENSQMANLSTNKHNCIKCEQTEHWDQKSESG